MRKELNENLIRLFSSSSPKLKVIDNLFTKFNTVNIRHENDQQIGDQFTEIELEEIYDDIYTTIIFLILSRQQIMIQDRYDKDLKSRITVAKQNKKAK